jgi:hypothetical protein
MNALRPATATVLAFWLGFLACVLGCSQPVLASTPSQRQIAASTTTANQDDTSEMADAGSCCHHRDGTSDQNKQGLNISCCPLDATLIQKQDLGSAKTVYPSAVALVLVVVDPSSRFVTDDATNGPPLLHAGRDVLLQIHILRI